ncbi:MAG: tetratricopeptide repeat protein, partial [Myxococcota bacterium]
MTRGVAGARPASKIGIRLAWVLVAAAAGVRLWNIFQGPLMAGFDAPGHIAYIFYLDRYGAIPWAHQGWGYFHPPLYYLLGWGLAQFGSAILLLRGLALWSSAASLIIAGLSAWVARAAAPERPGLAWLAFAAVAFVPVQIYASPMSGSELTCALLGCAAIAALIANERRAEPSLARDAGVGLLIGLALLSKFSGAVYLAAALVVIALRRRRSAADPAGWMSAARRCAALGGVALVLAGPYYLRNTLAYGTPFRMNRDYALTADVEATQAPGSRSWRDFVSVSPRLLSDPRPGAPHLVHSIWGSAYVNAWVDARSQWNRLAEHQLARLRSARIAMVWLGLLPTSLALAGAALAARDVRRGRRTAVYLPLFVCAALALVAFGGFAVRVPRISALKASYLFALSLPYGAFTARAVEGLLRNRVRVALGACAVLLPAAASAAVYSIGPVHPRLDHVGSLGAVHYLIGDFAAARAHYQARIDRAPRVRRWLEGLAAVELADGRPERARALYARANRADPGDPERVLRLATSAALAGDLEAARDLLQASLAHGGGAETRANLGAVLAAIGDDQGAENELRRAVSLSPDLAPAWHTLSESLERRGRRDDAATAHDEWIRASHAPPDDYPYDIGVGLLDIGMRPLLWFDGEGLSLACAPFRAG